MTERIEEIPNKASRITRCDRIILFILGLLISLSLFISIYIYFCGPVVLKGTDEFRMRHYEPFAFTAIALWIVHLIYGAIRRNVRKESANYFTSMADAFGKKPLLGSFVLVFLSSAIMHGSLFSKPIPTRYFLIDDSLMTLMTPVDIIVSKLAVVMLIYSVFRLADKILGRTSALFSALLIAAFQLNNNNCGVFAVESVYFALCASTLYLLLYCKEGPAVWGFPLLAATCILHPAGYALIAAMCVFFVVGGRPISFNLKVFAILTAITAAFSGTWYLSIRIPLLHYAREARNWAGYGFNEFYPLLKNTADNRIVLFLSLAGLTALLLGLFSKDRQKRQRIAIPAMAAGIIALWWWTEHSAFSMNALAAVTPGILILGGEAFSRASNWQFLTGTLFDRNIAAIIIIMLTAIIMTEYEFEDALTSATDYSIFEIFHQAVVGDVVPDEGTSTGYSLFLPKNSSDLLVFGTFGYLLPAEYEIRFKLKISDGDFTDGICPAGKITIFSVKRGEVLNSLDLQVPEQAQGRYNEFVIPFKISKITTLKLALRNGGMANMNLDGLRLIRKQSKLNEPEVSAVFIYE